MIFKDFIANPLMPKAQAKEGGKTVADANEPTPLVPADKPAVPKRAKPKAAPTKVIVPVKEPAPKKAD